MKTHPVDIRAGHSTTAARAFQVWVPVLFGYLPLGIAFGFLMTSAGAPWHAAAVMSLFVYAGSAQFLSVSLLNSGLGLWEIGMAVTLLNVRHVFYGLSFLDRYRVDSVRKAYLLFGLSDETYAILSDGDGGDDDPKFCLLLTAFNHSYWFASTLFGAILGTRLGVSPRGLDFALTCMFAVLTVEKAHTDRRRWPYLAGAAAATAALLLMPSRMLSVAFVLCATVSFLSKDRPRIDDGRSS